MKKVRSTDIYDECVLGGTFITLVLGKQCIIYTIVYDQV